MAYSSSSCAGLSYHRGLLGSGYSYGVIHGSAIPRNQGSHWRSQGQQRTSPFPETLAPESSPGNNRNYHISPIRARRHFDISSRVRYTSLPSGLAIRRDYSTVREAPRSKTCRHIWHPKGRGRPELTQIRLKKQHMTSISYGVEPLVSHLGSTPVPEYKRRLEHNDALPQRSRHYDALPPIRAQSTGDKKPALCHRILKKKHLVGGLSCLGG